TGYIVIAATTFLVGLSFVDLLKALQQEPTAMPVTELFYVTWYFWLILLLTTPIITMRLFALEKFSGTFETLMTTPVSDLQVVLTVSRVLLGVLAEQIQAQDSWQAQVLACFALAHQMHDFTRGVVDARPVVLFVSLTFFFLFLTLRIVESRRWK